jgi:hypothetical protein
MKGEDLIYGDHRGNHMMPNLTVRDYIAIQAINGLLSHPKMPADWEVMSKDAYEIADALIKQSELNHEQ